MEELSDEDSDARALREDCVTVEKDPEHECAKILALRTCQLGAQAAGAGAELEEGLLNTPSSAKGSGSAEGPPVAWLPQKPPVVTRPRTVPTRRMRIPSPIRRFPNRVCRYSRASFRARARATKISKMVPPRKIGASC